MMCREEGRESASIMLLAVVSDWQAREGEGVAAGGEWEEKRREAVSGVWCAW